MLQCTFAEHSELNISEFNSYNVDVPVDLHTNCRLNVFSAGARSYDLSKQISYKDNPSGTCHFSWENVLTRASGAAHWSKQFHTKSTVSKFSVWTFVVSFGLPRLWKAISLQPADRPMRGILKSHTTLNTHADKKTLLFTHTYPSLCWE